MRNCKRCGKQLKTPASMEVGYGPVCKRKQDAADAEFDRIQIMIDEVVESEVAA